MSRRHEDDAPNHAGDDPEKDAVPDEPVVPEAGEGPIPPVAGDPRPPIGN